MQISGAILRGASLKPHVERILARAREQGDERLTQLAERFLK